MKSMPVDVEPTARNRPLLERQQTTVFGRSASSILHTAAPIGYPHRPGKISSFRFFPESTS